MSSGEADTVRIAFGATLDEWRKCYHLGCTWHAHALLCHEHGGLARDPEFRTTDFGKTEWRAGYAGPATSPLREAV